MEAEDVFYKRRTRQELGAVSATADPLIKPIHLDLASRYAALRDGLGGRNSQSDLPEEPIVRPSIGDEQ